MKLALLGALATSALIGIVPEAYSEDYTITDLGTLGGNLSASTGINARGEVTGVSTNSSSGDYAFLYNGTTMLNLGTFAGGGNSDGAGINASGEVTGQAITSAGLTHAFLYNGTTMIDLGVLPGSDEQIAQSEGEAINANGEVAGTSDSRGGSHHAFLDDGTTMLDLGTLGGTYSVGLGINDRGEVTGAAYITGDATYHAFLYNGTTMVDLGTLGGAYSVGEAINASGEVTGYFATNTAFEHAFLYDGTKMIDLGTLGTSSVGYGVNNRGEVVGDTNIAGEGGTAFLYNNGAMFNLNSLISPTSPLYDDMWLNEATGINDLGQIVADGCYANGQCDAFLLTAVPEPSSWAMVLLGFAGLGFAGCCRARAGRAISQLECRRAFCEQTANVGLESDKSLGNAGSAGGPSGAQRVGRARSPHRVMSL